MTRAYIIAALAGCCLTLGGASMAEDLHSYSVAPQPWPEELGTRRARVQVDQPADAVWLHLAWRRRDTDPQNKRLIVRDAATGQRIANAVAARLDRESADLIFQAPAAGVYEVYYLPFTTQAQYGWYGGGYLSPDDTADPAWRAGLDLAGGSWRDLPRATVLGIEDRTAFNSQAPMQVVATADEVAGLLQAHAGEPYLVFPEDRDHAIWMTQDLPVRWVQSGPSDTLDASADRDEFCAFHLGVFASGQALSDVRVSFADLRGPGIIPASALCCFNQGGTNWDGQPLALRVDIGQRHVLALWCGVMIPPDAAPGVYEGPVTIQPADAPATTVTLRLTVSDRTAVDHGDNDQNRFTRLRWLDSTIAIDDEVTAPYTPLVVEGDTVKCLGRALRFGPDGLPASITANGCEILAQPMRFNFYEGGVPITAPDPHTEVTYQSPGAVEWQSDSVAPGFRVSTHARMEYDGHVTYRVTLTPDQETNLQDCALELPMRREVARYLMGIGHKGGYRTAEWSWKWGGQVYFDSFWMGDVPAGVQLELRGASYCGPMVNLYWNLGQLQPPTSWNNGGAGGCTVRDEGDDEALAVAYSGARTLQPGEAITFEFALLITPVKPLDPASHFKTRYYHSYEPVDKIAATGANVINIHHANELNPYINYPFLTREALTDYVRQANARNMKVKLYYTLRELTNHVAEMPALRALGHEVLAPGGGGGYPWLRENLGDDYSPAWYQPQPDGDACAAIVNSGLSRWYNYYLEGLNWLGRNIRIDGLYNDDVSYDRTVMKRVRKILDRGKPGCMIDLHSNTAFSHQPANQYMEFFPFIDRLWFGESFNYNETPDYWLTEISGIPYGLMGEMLQDGGNPWRGMVYGMTVRMPWNGDPTPLWKLWDEFGISDARMVGYWDPACPVRTDNPNVLATAYVREGKTLISVASWSPIPVRAKLTLDWQALGLDPARVHLYAPPVRDFQEETVFSAAEPIPMLPGRGWLLLADEVTREAPAYVEPPDPTASLKLQWQDAFDTATPDPRWQMKVSTLPGTSLQQRDGALRITVQDHACAMAQASLEPGTRMVVCKLNVGNDGGMTWGVGLSLVWPHEYVRVNSRTVEHRFGVDSRPFQLFFPSFVTPGSDCWLRIRIEADRVYTEASADGEMWLILREFARSALPGDPTILRVGKFDPAGEMRDAGLDAPVTSCSIDEVRVYTQ